MSYLCRNDIEAHQVVHLNFIRASGTMISVHTRCSLRTIHALVRILVDTYGIFSNVANGSDNDDNNNNNNENNSDKKKIEH